MLFYMVEKGNVNVQANTLSRTEMKSLQNYRRKSEREHLPLQDIENIKLSLSNSNYWKTEKQITEVEFGRDFCQPKKSDLKIEGA